MKRENNRGVSLIEILIAVVVFTILIIPIVNQLATSIRIGQRADAQQAATDYAKSIAETMKQVDISTMYSTTNVEALSNTLGMDDTLATSYGFSSVKADGSAGFSIPANSYLTTMPVTGGSTAYPSVTAMYQAVNRYNAENDENPEALVREYTFTGTAKIDYRNYDVLIRMDTKPYAVASLNQANYYDPNAVNLGNLSSLDADTTAVITNSSNSDVTAASSYYSSIISTLEGSSDPDDAALAVQIKNGLQPITARATKQINIIIDEVVGTGTPYKYQVTCEVVYDNPAITRSPYFVSADAATLEYTIYQQQFKEIPDVYLMYNQFMYNKDFGDDNITITSNIEETAKVYVIRTAETDANVSHVTSLGGNLIPTDTDFDRDVRDGSSYRYMTQFEIKNNRADHPVEIYTNIPLVYSDGVSEKANVVSSSDNVNDRTGKMSVNVPGSELSQVVRALEEDERYSEQGRIYNIYIELTNRDTGVVTTFDTSKGDY